MAEGWFREDLYYRLNVFPIPPAAAPRAARGHPLLVWSIINAARARSGGTSTRVLRRGHAGGLQSYDWPGNVRELENVIERALILSTGPTLRVEEFAGGVSIPRAQSRSILSSPPRTLDEVDREAHPSRTRALRVRVNGEGMPPRGWACTPTRSAPA